MVDFFYCYQEEVRYVVYHRRTMKQVYLTNSLESAVNECKYMIEFYKRFDVHNLYFICELKGQTLIPIEEIY